MYYKFSSQTLPRLTSIYYVTRNTTWRCADKCNILVFVKDGCCNFNINSTDRLIKTGQALLIPAGTPYIRTPYKNTVCTLYYIHFHTDESAAPLTHDEIQDSISDLLELNALASIDNSDDNMEAPYFFLPAVFDFSDRFDEIFSTLDSIRANEFKASNPYRRLNASLSLTKLLLSFSNTVIDSINDLDYQTGRSFPLALQKALLYIHKNYRKKISTQKLASVTDVSPQHIIRLFKLHLNTTPIEYINRTKIFHAIDMLRHTDMSIKEISYELGFDDPNYFSRLFKKEEKMSPKDTRHRIIHYDNNKTPSPIQKLTSTADEQV